MRNTLKSITIISAVSSAIWSCQSAASSAPISEAPTVNASIPIEQHAADSGLKSGQFINIKQLTTDIVVEMPYADTANFTGHRIYPCAECELRFEVAQGLYRAQELAKAKGYGIKVLDCYRPASAQQKMYDVYPDKRYVASPMKGSRHSSGCAVDLTLIKDGKPVDMGTAFDDFSKRAHTADTLISKEAQANRGLLVVIMNAAGFDNYAMEWWHYNFRGCDYPKDDHQWTCAP